MRYSFGMPTFSPATPRPTELHSRERDIDAVESRGHGSPWLEHDCRIGAPFWSLGPA